MKYFLYPLEEQKFINRFMTTGTFCQPQKFEKATLQGNINEWLKYGFSIYENPCRKEFMKARSEKIPDYLDISKQKIHDEIHVFGQTRTLELYYPFGNVGVDFSEFYFNPTYLRCYNFVYLFSDDEGCEEFVLETCGGATVWMNDQLITDFIPFTRNMVKSQKITMDLKKGFNKLIVCLDDLAERDTDYYFRLQYSGDLRLRMCIPAEDEVDVEYMDQVEAMLADISFEKEGYLSEPVELKIHNTLSSPIEIRVQYKPVADKFMHGERVGKSHSYHLLPGQKKLTLFEADDVIPGFYYFWVEAVECKIAVGRKIAVQVFHKKLLKQKENTIEERKREALHYLQEVEVENVYKAAAIFTLGGDWKKAEAIVLEEMEGIRLRKDCSDFHLVIILQIYQRFENQLSEQLKAAIRELVLDFRYWFDEPGDDVMWFFSENHALLFHICQYAAGHMFPEQVFSNSGLSGRELKRKAELLLEQWFDGFFEEYITEWNSNAYIPVDVLGLCSLYNLTSENTVWKEKAKRALDQIFYDMAVNAHKGTIMTTFGRSYEKEQKGNYAAGTTSLLYIAYHAGCLNRAALAYTAFALSEYEPPKEYQQYLQLKDGEELVYRKTQGYENHVNLYMYKNASVQLSTAVEFHPFTPGYQEHIMQATINPTAQVFINHPGEIQPYGNGRPNFWSGNGSLPKGVQYKSIGILQYRIPETHRIDRTHAYIPLSEFQRYIGDDFCVVVEQDGAYIGVKAVNGLKMQTEGPCKYREFISIGRNNTWVLKVGRKGEFYSLEEFYSYMGRLTVDVNFQQEVRVVDPDQGEFTLEEQGFYLNGKEILDFPLTSKGVVEKFLQEWHNDR